VAQGLGPDDAVPGGACAVAGSVRDEGSAGPTGTRVGRGGGNDSDDGEGHRADWHTTTLSRYCRGISVAIEQAIIEEFVGTSTRMSVGNSQM
jgi:hypothetical protein